MIASSQRVGLNSEQHVFMVRLVGSYQGTSMPFKVSCPGCSAVYNVKEKLAGKRTKCQKCGEVIVLNPPAEETSADGSPIYRHVDRDREFEPAAGDEETIDAISAHFEQHVGPIESVFHEVISDMVHLDVHWIKPTFDRDWHVLFTTGMSDRPMTVPEGADVSDYAELMMCLPGDWPVGFDKPSDEDFWPISWLKFLARLPHEYETWLGAGHTVPNGDPPEPLGANTKCVGSILLAPPWFDDALSEVRLGDRREVQILAAIPLYKEEMDLKLKKGAEGLIDRFEAERLPIEEVFDPSRKNVAKKRFGIF